MSKTLIAKPTLFAASALLLASLAGVHNVKAAEQSMPGLGAMDAHEQARRLLVRPDIAPSGPMAAPMAISIPGPVMLDAHEQARRLLSRPEASGGTGFEGAVLILKPEEVDAHTQAEHLLLRPLGY